MPNIFDIIDKTGRKIRLTTEQWSHIRKKHPEVENYELIEETLKKPDKITSYDIDETVIYYVKILDLKLHTLVWSSILSIQKSKRNSKTF